jgi:hypothetical protein
MPDRCVVPGCKSNYESSIKTEGYIQCFKFPSDPPRKQLWLRAIPRSDWTPSNRSCVCVKHFHEDDLIWIEKYKNKDGDWCEYRREKPVLSENAVPRLFPNLPSYLSNNKKTPKRKNPEERREDEANRIKKRLEDEEIRLAKENEVGDFTSFCRNLTSKIDCSKLSIFKNEECCIVYNIDTSKAPKISFSIRVNRDLSVEVHNNGGIIPNTNIACEKSTGPVLPNSILQRWSQFVELIKFCKNLQNLRSDKNTLIKIVDTAFDDLINILEKEQDENSFLVKNKDPLKILKNLRDQFTLVFLNKPKYTVETVLRAFLIYMQSVKCYNSIRLNNILCLPHPRYLEKVSASFNVSATNESGTKNLFKHLVKDLTEDQKYVNIQVDEIHIRESVEYKNGKLYGIAANDKAETAKTVVAFLVSSCFGSFKEVARLVPVKQLSGSFLADTAKNVIKQVVDSGLTVLALLSDNNRVNRVMFNNLTKDSKSELFFEFPGNRTKIYVLFDTVHIFKCIRNNWINLKDSDKTFSVPFWENLGKTSETITNDTVTSDNITTAKFSDLRTIHNNEHSMLVKSAPHLNHKTLYPNSFERQKVNLVVNVFNETTISALKKHLFLGTAFFVHIIFTWWSIMNAKRPLTYIIKRDPLKEPFTSVSDERFIFLDNFLAWLESWKEYASKNEVGFLTQDTYNALRHTTLAMKGLINYILVDIQVPYILTGKFQTDNIESRFGQYRQMAGGNYNISVIQIFEAEKKIRVKSLLGLHSSKYGEVALCANLRELECNGSLTQGESTMEIDPKLYEILELEYLDSVQFDKSGFLYVSGYISFKLAHKNKCQSCCQLLSKQSTNDLYFEEINRGGLSVPSDFILNIASHVIGIMNNLISEPYEDIFLTSNCQKYILHNLSMKASESDTSLIVDLTNKCHECGKPYEGLASEIISTMANVLLNNYSKKINDSVSRPSNKKRKLKILS